VDGADSRTLADVWAFLTAHHMQEINELEPLSDGFWSSAYAYTCGQDRVVLRIGTVPEGFVMDQEAMKYGRADLPVPEILEIGEAFGQAFAISRRADGCFLEDSLPGDALIVGSTLARLLAALRSVEKRRDSANAWRTSLLAELEDSPAQRHHGWRAALRNHAHASAAFERARRRVEELLPFCPQRGDLVHGDLLHRNVLLSADSRAVSAVFSWKCSRFGDFLYDTAWCTFWSDWHPGIAAADVWKHTINAADLNEADLADAGLRHHCYELQIGASHLGWSLWADDGQLDRITNRLRATLARGPRPH
jgi:aminoglycoside phosphotransferase (APT) family kinase protein